jgi:phage baseplate assembly protein gpV
MNHPIYRALVTFSDTTTGEIRIKIPSLLGAGSEVSISYIGRSATNGSWSVPTAGEQIVVTSDDENLTNIFWLRTDQPDTPLITVSTDLPTGGTAGDVWIVV